MPYGLPMTIFLTSFSYLFPFICSFYHTDCSSYPGTYQSFLPLHVMFHLPWMLFYQIFVWLSFGYLHVTFSERLSVTTPTKSCPVPSTNIQFRLMSLLIALWRYNSLTIKFTHLKYTIQWFFSVFTNIGNCSYSFTYMDLIYAIS